MDIPPYLKDNHKFELWMIILKKSLEEGDFKTQKWCGKILEKFA